MRHQHDPAVEQAIFRADSRDGWVGHLLRTARRPPQRTRAGHSLDLPGFGGAPHPDQRMTISQYADLVERAITTLGLDDPIVVAHSMGTQIAADLAARRPDLTSLILIGPVANASSGPFPGRRSGSCSRRGRKATSEGVSGQRLPAVRVQMVRPGAAGNDAVPDRTPAAPGAGRHVDHLRPR